MSRKVSSKKKGYWKDYISSFKTLDRRSWYSFGLDIAYTLSFVLFAFLFQVILRGMVSEMRPMSTSIITQLAGSMNVMPLEAELSTHLYFTYKLLFLILLFVLLVFLCWVLTRALIWKLFLRKTWKIRSWFKFLLLMFIWQIVIILPLIWLFGRFLNELLFPIFFSGGDAMAVFYFYSMLILASILFLLFYTHFSTILYYKFTVTQELKSFLDTFKDGVLKIKHFIIPFLLILLTVVAISVLSMVLLILPEIVTSILSFGLLFGFVTWIRWYYFILMKKHKL